MIKLTDSLNRRFAIGATILGAFIGVSAIKDVHDLIAGDVSSKWIGLYAMVIFFFLAILIEVRNKRN